MKVLLINGSPNEFGSTYSSLCVIENALNEEDIETEIIWLGNKPINDCIACYKCRELNRCVFDDLVNKVGSKCEEADGFIFATPTYYAHPTGRILSFLDRLFYSHKKSLAFKPCASISVARRAGTVTSFDVLNKYASISSMPIVSANYWNMVFASNKDEVDLDLEGLDTMINLAKNMAWLLKCIELGKNEGITHPENKSRKTNFHHDKKE